MRDRHVILAYAGASGHAEEIRPILEALSERYVVVLITNPTAFSRDQTRAVFIPDHGASAFGQILDISAAFLVTLRLINRTRPRLALCTGPVPSLGVLTACSLRRVPAIYIDTFCKIRNLSFTGKFARLLATVMLVQWEALLSEAGRRGAFWGRVV